MARNLQPLKKFYGPEVRPEDLDYLQWKLDYACGMRIAIKRFIDTLDIDKVQLPKRSRRKLRELIKASDDFQNYRADVA